MITVIFVRMIASYTRLARLAGDAQAYLLAVSTQSYDNRLRSPGTYMDPFTATGMPCLLRVWSAIWRTWSLAGSGVL